jgi:hypothetical protein
MSRGFAQSLMASMPALLSVVCFPLYEAVYDEELKLE